VPGSKPKLGSQFSKVTSNTKNSLSKKLSVNINSFSDEIGEDFESYVGVVIKN
jgi:hypothetical protein